MSGPPKLTFSSRLRGGGLSQCSRAELAWGASLSSLAGEMSWGWDNWAPIQVSGSLGAPFLKGS